MDYPNLVYVKAEKIPEIRKINGIRRSCWTVAKEKQPIRHRSAAFLYVEPEN